MAIKDTIDDVRAEVVKRFRNPVFGTFVIAWCIINWKFIAILFLNNQDIFTTIALLDKSYSSQSKLFWYPLLSTIMFVLLHPWTGYLVYRYRNIINKLREKHRYKSLEESEKNKQIYYLARAFTTRMDKLFHLISFKSPYSEERRLLENIIDRLYVLPEEERVRRLQELWKILTEK